MTDKVQKIRDWISKKQDGLMDANGNFENPSDEGAFHILTNLDYYIDKVQEEPVSEELENELNKYIKDYFTIDREQLDRFGIEEKDYMYSMDKSDMLALVEHFTNWQQERDEADRAAVYKYGWNGRKAMMMKKSFDAKILPANIEETEFCLDDYEEVAIITEMVNKGEFKMGDKVKVIVIKED